MKSKSTSKASDTTAYNYYPLLNWRTSRETFQLHALYQKLTIFPFHLHKIETTTKKNKNSAAIKIGKLESELKPGNSLQLETTQGKTVQTTKLRSLAESCQCDAKTTINGNSPQALEQLPDMLATLIDIGNSRSIAGSCGCSFDVGSEAQPSSCGRKPPWRAQGSFLVVVYCE